MHDSWENMVYYEPHISMLKLSDEGTRYKHYSELLEQWRLGTDVLENMSQSYQHPADKKRLTDLKAAVALLEKQLEVMSGYDKEQWSLREQVNQIPRDPNRIEGGRGTPVKEG